MSTLNERVHVLTRALSKGLVEREDHIKLMLLAALAGEHVLLIGPPGTAKSLLARRLRLAFREARFFERLLTQFSVPEDLFGPYSLEDLDKGRYRRLTEGYLADADVGFLDEIFKANPSILNALLTLLNERVFHNVPPLDQDGKSTGDAPLPLPVPLKCLVGASNEVPEPGELDALYDRFLIRCEVGPVVDFQKLLQSGSEDEPNIDGELAFAADELTSIRKAAKAVVVPQQVDDLLEVLRYRMAELMLDVSDRRWLKIRKLLQVAAYTSDREQVSPLDVLLVPHCVWSPRQEKQTAMPSPAERKSTEEEPAAETPIQVRNGLTTWVLERMWEALPTQPGLLDRQIAAWEKELQKLAQTPPEDRDPQAIKNQQNSVNELAQTTMAMHQFLHGETSRLHAEKLLEMARTSGPQSEACIEHCEWAQRWLRPKTIGIALEQLNEAILLVKESKQHIDLVKRAFDQLNDDTNAAISAPLSSAARGPGIVARTGGKRPAPMNFPATPKGARYCQVQWSEFLSFPSWEIRDEIDHAAGDSITLDFELIPPGHFQDQHSTRVEVAQPFLLCMHPVTEDQWRAITGADTRIHDWDPWYYETKSDRDLMKESLFPVVNVSRIDAVRFLNLLSELHGLVPVYGKSPAYIPNRKANGYRLPTEAEWEYACRAGTTTTWWCGDTEEQLKKTAWYSANAAKKRHAITEITVANPFNLLGMHGNVGEWCQENYAESENQDDDDSDEDDIEFEDSHAVVRGGTWQSPAEQLASAYGRNTEAGNRSDSIGFRVARTIFLDT